MVVTVDTDIETYPLRPQSTQSSPGGVSPPPSDPLSFDDTVIPASHAYRTLVLCFDGTGDQFDADNSNIVSLFSMLKKDDRSQQIVYYQAGIGTYTIPQIATPKMAKLSKAIDMAIANDLDAHVMGGYEFLMQNYQAEDKICIFGFSRGAYTASISTSPCLPTKLSMLILPKARALAGMIHKVGILPACNHQQVPFAYKMFSRDDEEGWRQSNAFKKAFSVDVEIEFLGVWDTVASVGLIPHRLPFTASNTAVRYFRHAISLDEHRAKFKANHWQLSPHEVHNLGTKRHEMPRSNQRHPNHLHHNGKVSGKHLERVYDDGNRETDVLEVWFAGCHCDVGGGSVANDTRHSLARIPLRWMIRQCFLVNSGIQFHRGSFKNIGLDPSSLYPLVLPRPPPVFASTRAAGSSSASSSKHTTTPTDATCFDGLQSTVGALTEEEEDLNDALSPIYDQLKLSKAWWILEFLPLRLKMQKSDRSWVSTVTINRGRARKIPKPNKAALHVHRTVKIRMESENYVPKAGFNADPIWED
ncbi:hypothetical protein EW146_g858 [Bondarzewia mesenterica]|uniref:T6SS Phospholipase effector Tle1-like catalytic domain-containing protein n=1 Tax=Bondarzewia mesenterica TaxID=1095465 RepID=A0A4S4M649_9AGAM|nr:hypothetical protein EW146_g858 [Bondarzewia mesenterica]